MMAPDPDGMGEVRITSQSPNLPRKTSTVLGD